MSIISSICAEADIKVVKAAVLRAKDQAKRKIPKGELPKVMEILDDLLKYCDERIYE